MSIRLIVHRPAYGASHSFPCCNVPPTNKPAHRSAVSSCKLDLQLIEWDVIEVILHRTQQGLGLGLQVCVVVRCVLVSDKASQEFKRPTITGYTIVERLVPNMPAAMSEKIQVKCSLSILEMR